MLADLEPIDVRQANVEDDNLGGIAFDRGDTLVTRGRRDHLRLRPTEVEGQPDDFDDVRLVVDDEYAHGENMATFPPDRQI